MIKDLSIEHLFEEISSNNPTPGGGVVAAIAGRLAASLIQMVCHLTIDKKKYEKYRIEVKELLNKATKISCLLEQLTEEDKRAFDEVMNAYQLRKKENSESNYKIIVSLRKATEVPTKVRETCQSLIVIAKRLVLIGNKNAISDTKTAIYMAEAGAKSALENIKINKKSLRLLLIRRV